MSVARLASPQQLEVESAIETDQGNPTLLDPMVMFGALSLQDMYDTTADF